MTRQRAVVHNAIFSERLRLDAEREKLARLKIARPLPDFSKPFVPKILPKDLTEFDPFTLQSVERHKQASSAFLREIESIKERERERKFHAKNLPKSTYTPYVLVKEERELVEPVDVHLASEERSIRRREYEEREAERRRREREEEILKEIRERAQEEEDVRRLRCTPVSEGGYQFIASSVLAIDPYPPKHYSPPPLTEPHSPVLYTSQRQRQSTVVFEEPSWLV